MEATQNGTRPGHQKRARGTADYDLEWLSLPCNPFCIRRKASLRARNLNGERFLKVNDKRGNPIEIAAVVVWRVDDTAKASFDVDSYENYVKL